MDDRIIKVFGKELSEEEFAIKYLKEEEKRAYVAKRVQGLDDNIIYGEIVNKNLRNIFVAPYNADGEKVEIFKGKTKKWGIRAQGAKAGMDLGDFVKGELYFDQDGKLYLDYVKKLKSEDEFYKELMELLRKKWQREGFSFDETIYRKFDKGMKFDAWAANEVEAKLEEKYFAFLEDKANEKEQELKNIESQLAQKKEELKKKKKRCDQENARLLEAKATYQRFKELGFISEGENKPGKRETYMYHSYKELADHVWGYLWIHEKLYYEKETVCMFMNALRTQQLILLWGRPGTGKTSLPKGVAKAVGAECRVIQVQSNWTDNQDILGFYNPVDKRYVSTQFLDAVVEARKHRQQLYLILLDEMNLSNVEYYFSEMLNFFTKKVEETYEIHLYSRKYQQDFQKDIQAAELEKEIPAQLRRQEEMLKDYTPVMEIPDNIRFIGTLNADETTKTISPKVIDRSCVIELQAISKKTKDLQKGTLPEQIQLDGQKAVEKSVFDVKTADVPDDAPVKMLMDAMREIFDEEDVPSPLSNRMYSYIDQWFGWGDDCAASKDDIEDEVVLGKFLPLLDNMEIKTTKNKRILKKIKETIYKNENSLKKLTAMEKQAEDRLEDRLMYWRN